MNRIPSMVLATVVALVAGLSITAYLTVPPVVTALFVSTWYVRSDGGTTTQCTGLTNAAYDGSGTGEACAYANPQDAINAAVLGDTIVLRAGDTFIGNFTLPLKSGSSYLTIQSSAIANLAEGVRVSPSQSSSMAKLQSNNVDAVVATPDATASHHYKFIGIEFSLNANNGFSVIRLGDSAQTSLLQVPSELIFDRCYIHGQPTYNSQRGITMNSASTSVTNSYISEIHWVGAETQALGGWNGPGPFTINNNYIEAAGINILFGGATPTIPNVVPSDITITNNYIFKPLRWRVGDPSYAGIHWLVKNLFELKNARRVTVTGNTMENAWPDGQIGWAVIFNTFKDGGWEVVEDVTMSRNTFNNTTYGIDMRGRDAPDTVTRLKRITIEDNYIQNLGAFGIPGVSSPTGFLMLNGSEDVTINHKTISGTVVTALGFGGDFNGHVDFTFINQLMPFGTYGVFGDGGYIGTAAFDRYCAAGYSMLKNALYAKPSDISSSLFPANNYFPLNLGAAVGLLGTDNLPVGVRPSASPTPTPPPSSVAGTITLGPAPQSGVTVRLLRASDRSLINSTATGVSGTYSLTGISTGTSVIVSPALTGYTYNPSEVLYSTISGNKTSNFAATAVSTPTPTPTPLPSPTVTPTPTPTPSPSPGNICKPNQKQSTGCMCLTKWIGNPPRCKP